MEVDTQGQHHQHNALNQLTTTQTDDQQTITHYYYSNGLRAGTSNGTQLCVHYYTRHNHRVNSTNHTAWSSHLMGQQAELRRSPTQADIMIRDRQGSIIQSVLPANTQGHDYSAHGLDTLTTDIPTLSLENNPWRYANYPYDNTTGLYYLQARDYNPIHRAFVQADSYAVNDYGLSNAYFYGNNPLNGADPTGHDFHDTMNIVSSVVAGAIGLGVLGGAAFLGSKMMAARSARMAARETKVATHLTEDRSPKSEFFLRKDIENSEAWERKQLVKEFTRDKAEIQERFNQTEAGQRKIRIQRRRIALNLPPTISDIASAHIKPAPTPKIDGVEVSQARAEFDVPRYVNRQFYSKHYSNTIEASVPLRNGSRQGYELHEHVFGEKQIASYISNFPKADMIGSHFVKGGQEIAQSVISKFTDSDVFEVPLAATKGPHMFFLDKSSMGLYNKHMSLQ